MLCRALIKLFLTSQLFSVSLPIAYAETNRAINHIQGLQLFIPNTIPGYISDPPHELKYARYKLRGIIYPATAMLEANKLKDRKTPINTLQNLLFYYKTSDLSAIVGMYTEDSRKKINKLMTNSKMKQRFIKSVSTINALKPLLGIETVEGFVIYAAVNPGDSDTIVPYYFRFIDGCWFVSSLVAVDPMLGNIAAFLRYHSASELLSAKGD